MGEALAAPFFVAAGLLAAAGLAKLHRPDPLARTLRSARLPGSPAVVRAIGLVEVGVGLTCLVAPRPAVAIALGLLYAAFAAFLAVVVLAKLPVESCGCLGEKESPPNLVHAGLNAAAAGVAFLVALAPVSGVPEVLAGLSVAAVPFAIGCVTAAYLAYLAAAFLPDLLFAFGQADGEATNERG